MVIFVVDKNSGGETIFKKDEFLPFRYQPSYDDYSKYG